MECSKLNEARKLKAGLTSEPTLVAGVLAGERRALAKAITLIESSRAEHQARAEALVAELLPHAGKSLRVGISGVPGVGKSTFIEALGLHLIALGHRVAVLAVDPSSTLSGGSILGDKTRMEQLSRREEAYIRPSPSSGALGGVAGRTREAMLLCEAAGYDVIIVETVGVGQSETAVAAMTDVFVLLQLPNAGDELQGLKKGIVELADIVVVNKCDVDARATQLSCAQLRSALDLVRPASHAWQAPVLSASALRNEGLDQFWTTVLAYRDAMQAAGEFASKRRHQALAWMWTLIESGLNSRFRAHQAVRAALPTLTGAVEAGSVSPAAAARQLLDMAH